MMSRPCPLCYGPYPADLVREVKSAKPTGKPMTADYFMEWLKQSA